MVERRNAWLVAAWPGMAAVGQIAGAYLHDHLGMVPLVELGANGWFEPESVRVEAGILQPERRPRSFVSVLQSTDGGPDLLLAQGEQQPTVDSMRYANAVLDACSARSVSRVVTFAALATAMEAQDEPRVFAASTTQGLLEEALAVRGVVRLDGAEVTGMNGQFLAAARERGIPALGLLGEVPYFATGLPNPKASAAVLRALREMRGLDLPLGPLLEQARRLEGWIVKQLKTSTPAKREAGAAAEIPAPQEEEHGAAAAGGEAASHDAQDVIQRIESLFLLAEQDRGKAQDLKAELDRHGLFREYENRFLDLFRKGS